MSNYRYFYYEREDYVYSPSILFSPDNQYVVAKFPAKILVWDLLTGSQIYSQSYQQEEILGMYFINELDLVLISNTKKMFFIDLSRGSQVSIEFEFNGLNILSHSPDGKFLITYDSPVLSIWDYDSKYLYKHRIDFLVNASQIRGLEISENGKKLFLLTYREDQFAIEIIDIETGQLENKLDLDSAYYSFRIDVSPTGNLLAIKRRHRESIFTYDFLIVDIRSNETLWTTSKTITDFKLINDEMLIANEPDGIVFYNARTGELLHRIENPGKIPLGSTSNSVYYSSDGKYAAYVMDESFVVIDLQDSNGIGTSVSSHNGYITGLGFSNDNRYAISVGEDGKLNYININGTLEKSIEIGENIHAHHFPNSLYPSYGIALTVSSMSELTAWDMNTGNYIRSFSSESHAGIWDYMISGNGKLAIGFDYQDQTGSSTGVIELWDFYNGELLDQIYINHDYDLYPYGAWINALSFSPDGRYLAIAVYASISIYDLELRKFTIHTPILHSDDIMKLAFSSDGNILASASSDGSVILWDTRSGNQIGDTIFGTNIISLAFNPDNSILATGDYESNAITLWNVSTREPIGPTLLGHEGSIEQLVFSSNGNYLVSADSTGTVIIWPISTNMLSSIACSKANRNLTLQEWQQYVGPEVPYHATCPGKP